jgi:hypothetical protein
VDLVKTIGQVSICALVVLLGLFFINPGKAVFPTVVSAIALFATSLLQKSTLIGAVKKSGVRRVVIGVLFLVLVVALPVIKNWRENAYVLPLVVSLVIFIASLTTYVQNRIDHRRMTR